LLKPPDRRFAGAKRPALAAFLALPLPHARQKRQHPLANSPKPQQNQAFQKLARGLLYHYQATPRHVTPQHCTGRQTMSINFDKALGISQQALNFRAQRAEVLANNIANADTPGYKARDMDFSEVLAAQAEKGSKGSFGMGVTNDRHIEAQGFDNLTDGTLKYRNSTSPSLDQNSVDAQIESSNYAQNAVGFNASFTLLNAKFKGLVSAIRGE
jgi:flagellar basal-body rod protein FlgB